MGRKRTAHFKRSRVRTEKQLRVLLEPEKMTPNDMLYSTCGPLSHRVIEQAARDGVNPAILVRTALHWYFEQEGNGITLGWREARNQAIQKIRTGLSHIVQNVMEEVEKEIAEDLNYPLFHFSGKRPDLCFSCEPEIFARVRAKANAERLSNSAVIRDAIYWYLDDTIEKSIDRAGFHEGYMQAITDAQTIVKWAISEVYKLIDAKLARYYEERGS